MPGPNDNPYSPQAEQLWNADHELDLQESAMPEGSAGYDLRDSDMQLAPSSKFETPASYWSAAQRELYWTLRAEPGLTAEDAWLAADNPISETVEVTTSAPPDRTILFIGLALVAGLMLYRKR